MPSANILAVTATATRDTISILSEVLLFKNIFVIYQSPKKPNIAYSVHYIKKENSLEHRFKWLSDELIELGTNTTRTIIYCQTIKQCTLIYLTIKAILGMNLYIGEKKYNTNVLLETLHSCTPEEKKETIRNSFRNEISEIRVLVATIYLLVLVLTARVFIESFILGHLRTLSLTFRKVDEQGEMGSSRVLPISFIVVALKSCVRRHKTVC